MNNLKIDITCNCGYVFRNQDMRFLRRGTVKRCPRCKTNITIADNGFTETQKELDKFEREMKRLFR